MVRIDFVHLSDIHFKKESNLEGDIDKDLRESILYDIKYNATEVLENVKGLLISGDIAFSGAKEEYQEAQKFISEMVTILKLQEYDVFCVPGNHDVDRGMVKNCSVIYNEQCRLDMQSNLDDADKLFSKMIHDKEYADILYRPIKEYNEFASKYNCEMNNNNTYCEHVFEVDGGFRIALRGINSCLISNADDGKNKNECRPMYIGQSQIPPKKKDVLSITMCHHPIECWKYKEDLVSRMDKRADIQLYGHKHKQTIDFSNDRLLLCAGAVHPVRGQDWVPRYNWLSIFITKKENNVIAIVRVYPRILSSDRNGFIPDESDNNGKIYQEFVIDITKKRDKQDIVSYPKTEEESGEVYEEINKTLTQESENVEIDKRKLVYEFFRLSYPKQLKILLDLDLVEDEDRTKNFSEIFNKIIKKATNEKIIDKLYENIEKCGVKNG